MLTGKPLGKAIEEAIKLKLQLGSVKTKTEIANHFDVKPPSIFDWMKKGSISKDKLPELFNYFSDVVGPEHWGLGDEPGWISHHSANTKNKINDLLPSVTPRSRGVLDQIAADLDAGRLSEQDMEVLKQIADRFKKKD